MNRQQTEWIYNHVESITNKYLAVFPLNDELWQQLHDEVQSIYKMSKENEEVKEILLVVIGYFDKLDVLYRKVGN